MCILWLLPFVSQPWQLTGQYITTLLHLMLLRPAELKWLAQGDILTKWLEETVKNGHNTALCNNPPPSQWSFSSIQLCRPCTCFDIPRCPKNHCAGFGVFYSFVPQEEAQTCGLHRGRHLAKNQVQIYITDHQLPKTLCMHPDKTKPNCRITNLWEREDTILTTKFLDSILHVTQQVLADTWHCWKWSCLVYSYFVPKKV